MHAKCHLCIHSGLCLSIEMRRIESKRLFLAPLLSEPSPITSCLSQEHNNYIQILTACCETVENEKQELIRLLLKRKHKCGSFRDEIHSTLAWSCPQIL